MDTYETIVGMEVHVELKTKSKMFCGCKNDPFYAAHPNIYTCPVCLGLPGALPVPNATAIEWTLRLGVALGCHIPLFSKFDRKNYFYPDLPKGYQISQYDQPFCENGLVTTEYGDVRIQRVHLEEDTGKLLHTTIDGKKVTLIDFNRSSVPLVEIVTEPDIRSGDHAKAYLKKLQQIVRYLGISDADMEKGSMRLEPNISVRIRSNKESDQKRALPNYKVEVKNINSFNFVKKAIEFETTRHIQLLTRGETPRQETRGYNADRGETYVQRVKENADDYRYFPEPDIPPFVWTDQYVRDLMKNLPEMPDAKRKRFSDSYGLNDTDSALLTETQAVADFFDETVRVAQKTEKELTPKMLANWIINRKIDTTTVLPAELISRIKAASQSASYQTDDAILESVLAENPKAVTDYRGGKTGVLMFMVGAVMKKTQGKANAELVKKKLQELMSSQ